MPWNGNWPSIDTCRYTLQISSLRDNKHGEFNLQCDSTFKCSDNLKILFTGKDKIVTI